MLHEIPSLRLALVSKYTFVIRDEDFLFQNLLISLLKLCSHRTDRSPCPMTSSSRMITILSHLPRQIL